MVRQTIYTCDRCVDVILTQHPNHKSVPFILKTQSVHFFYTLNELTKN